ncbi:MAG: hypothetical protein JXQ75_08220 [Phycisphaerae bacterium]|nr:hypothetical protein [Phycisphaerae bacterium]
MGTQIKWVRPTVQNVKALWLRIKDGQFRTLAGVPRFQLVKDVDDPDVLYITWTYDKTALVRCVLDDFPAYLPDEWQDQVHKVLRRIAGRELRPPSVDLSETDKAIDPVRRYVEEAQDIFMDKLPQAGLDEETESCIFTLFQETLDEMVGQRMIKGT